MARLTLWLFIILLGIDLGAGVYEARIVVPLWAGGIPESLAPGDPYGRVAIAAGMRFWAIMTPAVAAAAVLALVFGIRTPASQRVWRTFAALCELAAVAMTLLYFRPTLVRLFMGHGVGLAPDAISATVRHWVMWSRVRIAVSLIAWCAALHARTLPEETRAPRQAAGGEPPAGRWTRRPPGVTPTSVTALEPAAVFGATNPRTIRRRA